METAGPGASRMRDVLDQLIEERAPWFRRSDPASRLARAYAELGRVDEALRIAVRVREFAATRHARTDASWIAEIDAFRNKLLSARGGK